MAQKYSEEVDSLNNKLRKAQMNRPREREAQFMANILFEEKKAALTEAGEELDKEDERKLRDRLIKKTRAICGAARYTIPISDKEWEAIQNGALSHTKVAKILERADADQVRQRATPKKQFEWTNAKQNIALTMANSGWTMAEIAERLGTSTTTIAKCLDERS